jgi:hypothetical protein
MDTLDSGTTLLIVGDGCNNYFDPHLDIFSWISEYNIKHYVR